VEAYHFDFERPVQTRVNWPMLEWFDIPRRCVMKVWTRIPILAALLILPLAAIGADGADGMVTTQSNYSVAMTADKLVSTLTSWSRPLKARV
jgi:hypothetical protein